jgi:hypothetical protein
MHIQHEVSSDKKSTTNNLILFNQILPSKQRSDVTKTREKLLIMIGILLVSDEKMILSIYLICIIFIQSLCLLHFINCFISYVTKTPAQTEGTQDIYQLTSALVSIVYYGLGFFVAWRYSRIGLLIVCNHLLANK